MSITFPTKTKPVSLVPVVVAKPNHYRVCRDATHKPFRFWRDDVLEEVCDVCNWGTAYNNREEGGLWQYPETLREPLKEALEHYYQEKE